MAVVIQRMLPTDVFAVVFSRNPVDVDADDMLVNASYGLGEPVVSGTVTPDTFRLSRSSGQPLEHVVGAKATMAVPSSAGGVEMVGVPRLLRAAPCLTGDQLRKLAELTLAVEAWHGAPVDLECGLHRGVWFLLQARPITTLGSRQIGAPERSTRLPQQVWDRHARGRSTR
jgi:pyruvate,water dikinase